MTVSPGFPPLRTVHAPFSAHGAPPARFPVLFRPRAGLRSSLPSPLREDPRCGLFFSAPVRPLIFFAGLSPRPGDPVPFPVPVILSVCNALRSPLWTGRPGLPRRISPSAAAEPRRHHSCRSAPSPVLLMQGCGPYLRGFVREGRSQALLPF